MQSSIIMSDWDVAQRSDIFQQNHPACTLNKQGRSFLENLIERRINPCYQCSINRQICKSETECR